MSGGDPRRPLRDERVPRPGAPSGIRHDIPVCPDFTSTSEEGQRDVPVRRQFQSGRWRAPVSMRCRMAVVGSVRGPWAAPYPGRAPPGAGPERVRAPLQPRSSAPLPRPPSAAAPRPTTRAVGAGRPARPPRGAHPRIRARRGMRPALPERGSRTLHPAGLRGNGLVGWRSPPSTGRARSGPAGDNRRMPQFAVHASGRRRTAAGELVGSRPLRASSGAPRAARSTRPRARPGRRARRPAAPTARSVWCLRVALSGAPLRGLSRGRRPLISGRGPLSRRGLLGGGLGGFLLGGGLGGLLLGGGLGGFLRG